MARGKRTDPMMVAEIDGLASQGVPSPAIQATLTQKYGPSAPGLRTIQDRAREIRQQEARVPWTLDDTDDPEEAIRIINVKREWVLSTHSRPHQFTKDEAKWVGKISGIVPDLPPMTAWRVARVYQVYYDRPVKTGQERDVIEGLEYFLAFAPWRDDAHFLSYRQAVESGSIPKVVEAAWDYESRINKGMTR